MNKPQISIVVPAYDEEKLLPRCLRCLRNQNFKGQYEIIVVNGPSADMTKKIALQYADTVIDASKIGIGLARNLGCKRARANIIAVTDADVFVPRDWLKRIYTYFEQHDKVIAISGPYIFANNKTLNFISIIIRPLSFWLVKLLTKTEWMSGTNSAFRKWAYQKAGGYNPEILALEDVDLAKRLSKIGKIRYIPTLVVKTTDRRFRNRTLKHIFFSVIPSCYRRMTGMTKDKVNLWPKIR